MHDVVAHLLVVVSLATLGSGLGAALITVFTQGQEDRPPK